MISAKDYKSRRASPIYKYQVMIINGSTSDDYIIITSDDYKR